MLYTTGPALNRVGIGRTLFARAEANGLVPPVMRDATGRRLFTEQDIERLRAWRRRAIAEGRARKPVPDDGDAQGA